MNTQHGRGDRTRTCGIQFPKLARYQLRYTSLFRFQITDVRHQIITAMVIIYYAVFIVK